MNVRNVAHGGHFLYSFVTLFLPHFYEVPLLTGAHHGVQGALNDGGRYGRERADRGVASGSPLHHIVALEHLGDRRRVQDQ